MGYLKVIEVSTYNRGSTHAWPVTGANSRDVSPVKGSYYLEGHGDFVSWLLTPISHTITPNYPHY